MLSCGMDDTQEQDQYEERLKEVFNSFDASGSGSLSPEELADLCLSLQLDDATPALLHTLLQSQDRLAARVRSCLFCGLLMSYKSLVQRGRIFSTNTVPLGCTCGSRPLGSCVEPSRSLCHQAFSGAFVSCLVEEKVPPPPSAPYSRCRSPGQQPSWLINIDKCVS